MILSWVCVCVFSPNIFDMKSDECSRCWSFIYRLLFSWCQHAFFPPANFGYLLNPTNDILHATARTFHMAALTDSCKEIGRHSGKCQCQLCIASNYFNEEIIFPFSYPATAFSASQFKN